MRISRFVMNAGAKIIAHAVIPTEMSRKVTEASLISQVKKSDE